MKKLERILIYSVLAILVFYVFLVDGNVESKVAIQEEIRARRIAIVNNEGREVVFLSADSRTERGGRVDVFNGDGTFCHIFSYFNMGEV
jgi:branched-subunit amino acid transport protein AzlD